MKVNDSSTNIGLLRLIDNFSEVIPLDANIIIPPDRSKILKKGAPFDLNIYRKWFLDPLFLTFPYLAVHEAVLEELTVLSSTKRFVEEKIEQSNIIVLRDSELDMKEQIYRDSIERDIAQYTKYEPAIDNSTDRGEVKSLSYIAVKQLLYFSSNETNAIRLINDAERLGTHLEIVDSIQMYELIYYLLVMKMAESNGLKALYKYLYYLTPNEQKINSDWPTFQQNMNNLYLAKIQKSENRPTPIL